MAMGAVESTSLSTATASASFLNRGSSQVALNALRGSMTAGDALASKDASGANATQARAQTSSANVQESVKVTLRTDYSGADLRNANFSGMDLRGYNFGGADLRGANLTGARMDGVNLRDASLRNADFGNASLAKADLRGADFRGANVGGASMEAADLTFADVRDVDFRSTTLAQADMRSADLRGAKFGDDLSGVRFGDAGMRPVREVNASGNIGFSSMRRNLSVADLDTSPSGLMAQSAGADQKGQVTDAQTVASGNVQTKTTSLQSRVAAFYGGDTSLSQVALVNASQVNQRAQLNQSQVGTQGLSQANQQEQSVLRLF